MTKDEFIDLWSSLEQKKYERLVSNRKLAPGVLRAHRRRYRRQAAQYFEADQEAIEARNALEFLHTFLHTLMQKNVTTVDAARPLVTLIELVADEYRRRDDGTLTDTTPCGDGAHLRRWNPTDQAAQA